MLRSTIINTCRQHNRTQCSIQPQLIRWFASDASKQYDVTVIGGGPGMCTYNDND